MLVEIGECQLANRFLVKYSMLDGFIDWSPVDESLKGMVVMGLTHVPSQTGLSPVILFVYCYLANVNMLKH